MSHKRDERTRPTTWAPRASRHVTEDDIRLLAYEIYLARGDAPGDALSDWLLAERELLGTRRFFDDENGSRSY